MDLEDDAPGAAGAATAFEVTTPHLDASPIPYLGDPPNVEHIQIQDQRPVESLFIERLMRLLVSILYAGWKAPGDRPWAAFNDVGLFPQPKQTYYAPDFMLSLDVTIPQDQTPRAHRSYFVWIYGKPPDLILEVVSDRTGGEDSHKMLAYQRMRVPYYLIFDPDNHLKSGVLRGFALQGTDYVACGTDWLPGVGLGLREWEGTWEGMTRRWLRWCDHEGQLIPTPQERIQQADQRAREERLRAEEERLRADEEHQRAEKLAQRLRDLGIDPETP